MQRSVHLEPGLVNLVERFGRPLKHSSAILLGKVVEQFSLSQDLGIMSSIGLPNNEPVRETY